MSQTRTLKVIIRTPLDTIYEVNVRSLRVPTQSGQIGLRPGAEPSVLPIEAGLILLHTDAGTKYAGTAGGLLHNSREAASLLTPLAVVGENIDSVSEQLDALMAAPSEEMEVRKLLGRLETKILQEIQHTDGTSRTQPPH